MSDLKLGKLPARVDPRTLRLTSYLKPSFIYAPPPAVVDNSGAVRSWGMYGNDQYGDCVVAAFVHFLMEMAAVSSIPLQVDPAAVVRLYLQLSPQDQGLNELSFLNFCRQQQVFGSQLLGFASIAPHDMATMEHAIAMFGGVFRGILLPASAQSQVGGTWDLASFSNIPGSWGGHATWGLAYDHGSQRTKDVTWGQLQNATYRFWQAYQDEMYVLIPTYPVAGFDRDSFIRDLQAIGQYVGPQPAPTPPQPTPPSPTPPTPPSPTPPTPTPPQPTPPQRTPLARLLSAVDPVHGIFSVQAGVDKNHVEIKDKSGLPLNPRAIVQVPL